MAAAALSYLWDFFYSPKIRTILLPGKLCRKLQKYAKKKKIVSGKIFLIRNEKGLTRRQIWAEMKALCEAAEVKPFKVFPHNLRHLFARTFYHVYRDIAKLADVLGHCSIETTRIYLISTSVEHARQLERLGLNFLKQNRTEYLDSPELEFPVRLPKLYKQQVTD